MKSKNVIYGIRPLIEAVKSGKEVDRVLFQSGLKGSLHHELKSLVLEYKIPFQYVPVEKLNRITGSNHQGVIGFISQISYQPLENILLAAYEGGKAPFILVLDGITDVRNFGAIARTAECAGVHAVVVPSKGSAQINEDAVKTSAGALLQIPVSRSENLSKTIALLKDCGLQIVACTEKSELCYGNPDYTKPTAVIIGSEEDGISKELLENSDYKVKIPLFGEIESLNVSVTAGIMLYEIVRQRDGK